MARGEHLLNVKLDRLTGLSYGVAMNAARSSLPVRDRILAVAATLFYEQGYRATGVNQVIAESGVAKASFYDHFPSKDDLLLAYAKEMEAREIADMRAQVMAAPTARERFFGPLTMLIPWLKSSDFRGCPFQNLVAEVDSDLWRVRDVARDHRENVRALLRELARDLLATLDPPPAMSRDELADTYLVLFEGAIVTTVAYRHPWPVEQAIRSVEACLRPAPA